MIIDTHVVTARLTCSIDSRRRRNAKCAPGPPRRSNPVRMAPPARGHRNWHSDRRLLRRCGPASPSIFFARLVVASARRKSSDTLCAHASSRCRERAPGIRHISRQSAGAHRKSSMPRSIAKVLESQAYVDARLRDRELRCQTVEQFGRCFERVRNLFAPGGARRFRLMMKPDPDDVAIFLFGHPGRQMRIAWFV
jgi:hypothetical protein